jgi:hypothetical protein
MPAEQKKKTPIGVHLLAGGGAGMAEALACHPLDTIKVSHKSFTASSLAFSGREEEVLPVLEGGEGLLNSRFGLVRLSIGSYAIVS